MTTILVEIEDTRAAAWRAAAARRGITVEEYLKQSADRDLNEKQPGERPDFIAELQKIWAKLPPDYKPPTDEEIEQLLNEIKLRNAGAPRSHARTINPRFDEELDQLWATFPPDYKPPTDEEVERIVDEYRSRKALL